MPRAVCLVAALLALAAVAAAQAPSPLPPKCQIWCGLDPADRSHLIAD